MEQFDCDSKNGNIQLQVTYRTQDAIDYVHHKATTEHTERQGTNSGDI